MHTKDQQAMPDVESEAFTDAELAALRARLEQDPAAARAFAVLQKQGFDVLRKLARDAMATLAAMEVPQKTADASTDWRRFTGLARDRENSAKERRELAQDLVIGALVNIDNPDWNPLDPSTSRDSSNSTFLALLSPTLTPPQKNGV
jgi:hypothetical protein